LNFKKYKTQELHRERKKAIKKLKEYPISWDIDIHSVIKTVASLIIIDGELKKKKKELD